MPVVPIGYGIEDGRFLRGYENGFVVDLETATDATIPGQTQYQSQPIPELKWNLSQIVSRGNEQFVSVGSSWDLTGPLPEEMRAKMERTGLCLGCHQEMTNENIWSKVNEAGWATNEAHQNVLNKGLKACAESRSQ